MKKESQTLEDFFNDTQEHKLYYQAGRVDQVADTSYTKLSLFNLFEKLENIKLILVSEEMATRTQKKHYHYLLGFTSGPNDNLIRDKVISVVKEHTGAKGNKQIWHSKEIENVEALKSYTLKEAKGDVEEKNYLSKGISERRLKQLIKTSYKKLSKIDFDEEIYKLKDQYVLKKISKKECVDRYIELHLSYSKPIMENIFITRLKTWDLQRHPEKRVEFRNYILEQSRPRYLEDREITILEETYEDA